MEIEEAESRHAPISATPELIVSPPAHKPISYDPMFTESGRFEVQEEPLPQSHRLQGQLEPMETPPPAQGRPNRNVPIVPVAADLYTDEFSLEELEEQVEQTEEPAAPEPEEEPERPAPPPARPLASRLRQRQGQHHPAEAEPEQVHTVEQAKPVEAPSKPPEPEEATRVMEPVKPPKQPPPKKPVNQPEDATKEIAVPVKKPRKPKPKAAPQELEQRTTEWPAVKPEKPRKKPQNSPEQLSLLGTLESPEPAAQEQKAPPRPAPKEREPDQISFF